MRVATGSSVPRRIAVAAVAALLATTLASCAEEPNASGTSDDAGTTSLTLGLTYIPNIQFAPFYVAEEKGYYKDAGLDVTLHHHSASEDLFGGLKAGKEDLVIAGGDEIVQGRAGDIPVVSVMTLYKSYPVALLVRDDSPVRDAADLKGRTIGVPGPYGETYFGLLALLAEGGLTTDDVDVKSIGYTQQAALTAKRVDGVMGFVNNDQVQFEQAGLDVRAVPLTQGAPLISSGVGASDGFLEKRPDDVRKFVAATLRGVEFTLNNPEEAVELSRAHIPTLKDDRSRSSALAVLKASAPLIRGTDGRLGAVDARTWSRMADFMKEKGLIKKEIPAEQTHTEDYLPKE
ncbi:riboflavin-binding protein RibY [Streptomyces sp. NBRC 14336]|uniref:riboflavin ABC transporter substrate-binding protein RibY n=1 Tax=Streptomyces sp. NBRC 14336 TaxID=3030992 RepID=UPI0024A5E5F3|nr:riboflavin ABC transporter substrate-binding protein RibY [Streptomyces sp. NBRC 14336]WBO76235.1 riboflavin ABC transporter substrate-binding protein RibY [Streptomyces sp. SBE_14.2]GLW46830.1 riboflavin-binding protein RibY [Streptomyces sp. NBRC 14336]